MDDLRGLLVHLNIERAHIGGLSMGGNVALNFGLTYPEMARSLIVAGTGAGSTDPEPFRRNVNGRADRMRAGGMEAMEDYLNSGTRVQLAPQGPAGVRGVQTGVPGTFADWVGADVFGGAGSQAADIRPGGADAGDGGADAGNDGGRG